MAELDLINISPSDILDLLKKAYYDQTGETIQIGSDAFATSAVQSYVWSVLLNNINENTRNRFIDDATGSFLDAIAATYGISERPDGYRSSAVFVLYMLDYGSTIPANAIVLQDSSGNKFTNPYAFLAYSPSTYVAMQAIEAGTRYNGIPEGEINDIVAGGAYISAGENTAMTAGGTDGYPYTAEGDDAYREWLKTEIQSFAGAGTYQAYEARAKNADSRVTGVYVLRQDDDGYQKGKVQIYITAEDDHGEVRQIVQDSCADPAFRPIGDLVIVDYSPLTDWDISKTIQVTYPQRFNGIASDRNARIYAEYKDLLKKTINRPFVFEEFCSLLTKKDDDGVYALDAKCLGLGSVSYPKPIYPEIGGRLNIQDLSFENVFASGA